jgi:ClpP class serine protease
MLFLHQILNGFWAIEYGYSLNYLPLITPWMQGERPSFATTSMTKAERESNLLYDGVRFATINSDAYTISELGLSNPPEDAPDNSVAIITISGAITKQDQNCGPAGMVTKSNILQRCYANDNIQGIVLDIDSGGGSSYGMFLFNETLAARNKPVVGFANDMAASAAYGILSGCDLAIANNDLAQIGCIGTISTIIDYSEQLKKQGINLIEVYASQSTDKNNEFREALKGNLDPLQAKVDTVNAEFLNMVKTNRLSTLTGDETEWNTGKTFFATEAKKIGLIDGIDSFQNILNYFN